VSGRELLVGTRRLLERYSVPADGPTRRRVGCRRGKRCHAVVVDGEAAGVIAAADTVRPSAAQAISGAIALGIEPVMMTATTADRGGGGEGGRDRAGVRRGAT
jgi:Cu+-exporting ATPase